MSTTTRSAPAAFIWRRIHSLFGFAFTLFLTEHLITNSQSALFFGNDGNGFIRAVNWLHSLPYLPVIEIALLGIPILFHAALGIKYALTGKANSMGSSGTKPSLTRYGRNHAYTWQRITSWILLFGVGFHVAYMRFIDYPETATLGSQHYYLSRLSLDPGLYTVAKRLNVTLYSTSMIEQLHPDTSLERHASELYADLEEEYDEQGSLPYSPQAERFLTAAEKERQQVAFYKALTARPLRTGEVIAASPDFGTATLLMVRNAFKNIWVEIGYTLFVLAAVFHGFNGLWTFLITWGMILRLRSQKTMVNVCVTLTVIMALLGLASIWGTYWINLKS